MLIDLLGRLDDKYEGIDKRRKLEKLIKGLRESYLNEGNDPLKFTEYLEQQGIRASGGFISLDEKWDTYIALQQS